MEVYNFQGQDGEEVPETVEKLIVEDGVQELPEKLCFCHRDLLEVTLPNGLIKIGNHSFCVCDSLLEITIRYTVQTIGDGAFKYCRVLTNVEFEVSTSSPHQLQTIGEEAFRDCHKLQRIKIPSTVNAFGPLAFANCRSLREVDLSTTCITGIHYRAFAGCQSLQTAILPNTLTMIGSHAFRECGQLVTVVLPVDSQPIGIGHSCFDKCKQLANLMLPTDSTAESDSFTDCDLLIGFYGDDSIRITSGLTIRFKFFPIHRVCYDHLTSTVEKLRQCIAEHQQMDYLVDHFGMTPLHVLVSTSGPRVELLEVLLETLPANGLLRWEDDNDRQPLDYLVINWNNETKNLFQVIFQKWIVDRFDRWRAASWKENIQRRGQALLSEEDKQAAWSMYNDLYFALERYENIQATSILEMALWKWSLKSGRTTDGTKRQALDRDECRCLCGSDVVIPKVTVFLYTGNDEDDH